MTWSRQVSCQINIFSFYSLHCPGGRPGRKLSLVYQKTKKKVDQCRRGRRTSNFLEPPSNLRASCVSEETYKLVFGGSRLYSLPSPGYNQRNCQECYRLRSFSIRKGRVINLGESVESRRSRPGSHNASGDNSGCASPRSVTTFMEFLVFRDLQNWP